MNPISTPSIARKQQFQHETWLGMVQPTEGLVLSIPTLVEAQCAERQNIAFHHAFRELLVLSPVPPSGGSKASPSTESETIPDLYEFLTTWLDWRPDELKRGADLPADLKLYVQEGPQELQPTFILRSPYHDPANPESPRPSDLGPVPDSPATHAGAGLTLMVWDLPQGLPLDAPETQTGEWRYPPARKFERLMRHCRVPLGLVSNGQELRLIYAPYGESMGSITFRVADMAQTAGRPILDALMMLLSADALFSDPDQALPTLCRKSRTRQADVTEELARQVFDALGILLQGFEAAATRSPEVKDALDQALGAENNHLYGGLLATLLRLVFVLYAEDNGILPTEDPTYQAHLSVLGLFAQLRDDAAAHPESMDRRFGAWPRLLALFRAVHGGLNHGTLQMPPRYGRLFDPGAYPFIEGRGRAGAMQTGPDANAAIPTPRVADGTVYAVLERLLILEGQRLSYRALDVEQIGSVYERLMGYQVQRLHAESVCIKAGSTGAWISADILFEHAPAQRAKWLQSEWGVPKAIAAKLAKALKPLRLDPNACDGIGSPTPILDVLETQRFAPKSVHTLRRAAGRLVLQPGKERIRTSSHYTPRALSLPIVKRTLDPIIAALGKKPTAEQLLSLKICDPAMGSGAFLVEACRYLGAKVEAAWSAHRQLAEVADQGVEPTIYARRLVAQRCLYGVDKNRFAVDLARMSLWLVTLARDEPFTFVDHALRHGDTLAGLTLDQIRAFHWDQSAGVNFDLFNQGLMPAISVALRKRKRILSLADEEGAGLGREKRHLLDEAEAAMRVPRLVADALIGAWFSAAKPKDKEAERQRRLMVIEPWLSPESGGTPGSRVPAEVEEWSAEIHQETAPFHWPLEFPEIFSAERNDPLAPEAVSPVAMMDAFIGNPPFAGKNAISASNGDGYIKWLQLVHPGSHGNADLSAHFFRRAESLLGDHGTMGLIATNTISQGDTRATGLQFLVNQDHQIYEATHSMPWPGNAAVTIDIVHLAKGSPAEHIERLMLDGALVPAINSRLRPTPERSDPVKLRTNKGGAYVGTYVLGMGFTLTPAERDEFVEMSAGNAARIFPYIGGQELNSDPAQHHTRFVISFGEMTLSEAEQWPDLIGRVRRLVKPDRDRLKDNPDGRRRKTFWWQFGRWTPALYRSLSSLDRCLACARVSKHLMFAWQPTDRIFSEQLNVFPLDRDAHLGLLQSRIHERWARLLASSLDTRLRYGAGDCFETFPFPLKKMLKTGGDLDRAGAALNAVRAAVCLDKDQGLTKTYNDLKDPENTEPAIVELRELHLDIDRAVIEAYGWQDVPVPRHLNPRPGTDDAEATMPLIDAIPPFTTPHTDAEKRAHQRFEDAIIDQLFALNEKRAAAEARAAKRAKPKKKPKKKPTLKATITAKGSVTATETMTLAEQGDFDL